MTARLLTVLATASSLALLFACTPAKDSCHLPSIECAGRCVDGYNDRTNCGGCGITCTASQTCCGGCVDVQTDERNCGGCGQACPTNGVCTDGACACPTSFPDACTGACVNLDNGNAGYCGQCGWTCAGTGVSAIDAPCSGGTCHCAGGDTARDCGNGGTGQCVNTLSDEMNCGGCYADAYPSHVCKPGAVCTNKVCGCTNPALPNECPTACVNWQTDAAHCGGCNTACLNPTPICSSGRCCGAGETNCSGNCVDRSSNDQNCGTCGNACAAGRTCVGGTCVCGAANPVACGGNCCAGTACCGGSTCQTQHSNGLGGHFYDCNAPYTFSTATQAAALAAANSWSLSGNTFPVCNPSCVARQTTNACAVWCWKDAGPGFAGHVTMTTGSSTDCFSLCNDFLSSTPTWN